MSPPAILRDRPAYRTSNLLIMPHLRIRSANAKEFIKQKKELHSCNSFFHYEPLAGIEPATYWLQVSCSTSWAKEAYLNGGANIEGLTYSSKSTPTIFSDSCYLSDSEDLNIKTLSESSAFSSIYRSPLPLSEFWHQTVLLTCLLSWKQQKSQDCFSKV